MNSETELRTEAELTIGEEYVAAELGITVDSLRNRIYSGINHPPYIEGTRPKRFLRTAFEAWLKSRQVKEAKAS